MISVENETLIERASKAYCRGRPERQRPCKYRSVVSGGDSGIYGIQLENVNGVLGRYHYNANTDRMNIINDYTQQ